MQHKAASRASGGGSIFWLTKPLSISAKGEDRAGDYRARDVKPLESQARLSCCQLTPFALEVLGKLAETCEMVVRLSFKYSATSRTVRISSKVCDQGLRQGPVLSFWLGLLILPINTIREGYLFDRPNLIPGLIIANYCELHPLQLFCF